MCMGILNCSITYIINYFSSLIFVSVNADTILSPCLTYCKFVSVLLTVCDSVDESDIIIIISRWRITEG